MPLAPFTLDTPRLRLRPVAESDLPDLMAVNGDPEVTRFLPYATWTNLGDAAAWLARMQVLQASGSGLQLVLEHRETARAVGTVLLFKLDEASARVELGYVLGRAHWGSGLMREALRAVIGHAFSTGGIRRIEAEVNPDNGASHRLLQALSFTLEGRARQRWVAKGVTYDTHLYGLLADEWPPAPG